MLLPFKKSLLSLSLLASATLLVGCGSDSLVEDAFDSAQPPTPTTPDTNTAPVVTGEASPTVAENSSTVGTYVATDAESNAVTLTITGTNAELFSITTAGVLSFITAPDFETGGAGPFAVTVVATDDGEGTLAGELAIQVTVSDVVESTNSAPLVSGNTSPSVAENTTAVSTYDAADVNGDTITFSVSGADASLFSINNSGDLSFITAPDYDIGETGPYSLNVVVTDDGEGNLSSELAIEVTVTDVLDPVSNAVVQTISPDYASSEVAFLNGQTQQVTGGFYVKDRSDYTINTYQSDIYHIGRGSLNKIDKYNNAIPGSRLWSFSTNDSGVSTDSNAYSLAFVSATKAYLIRYDTDTVWIVNPQAEQAEDFKIGELSLTDYILPGNVNGTPRPSAATIVDGKLFIVMQRMSDSWVPDTAYVAVFDTETDLEIETNANADDAVKGIPVMGVNPLEDSIYGSNGKVYVTTRSPYFPADVSMSRIEAINPTDYSLSPVLTAAAITDNATGMIEGSVVVSDEKGYFFTSAFDADFNETSTLYEFNPTTGAIVASDVGGNGTETITFITLDTSNTLWVSAVNPATPGVDLINTNTNAKIGGRMLTTLNPNAIRFVD
ncbi:MAG: hypothetical protein ACI8WB_001374 [Phenylobacterium sp.]|jgi:hypothetical protein